MSPRLLALAPLTLLVATLAACGSDDDMDSASDSTASSNGALVVAAEDGIKWDKDEYSAAAGDVVVELQNNSTLQHNLYLITDDGTQLPEFLEVTASRGEEDSDTFTLEAGTYTVICTIPGHGGMKATLTVS
jgi:plastocyanin